MKNENPSHSLLVHRRTKGLPNAKLYKHMIVHKNLKKTKKKQFTNNNIVWQRVDHTWLIFHQSPHSNGFKLNKQKTIRNQSTDQTRDECATIRKKESLVMNVNMIECISRRSYRFTDANDTLYKITRSYLVWATSL